MFEIAGHPADRPSLHKRCGTKRLGKGRVNAIASDMIIGIIFIKGTCYMSYLKTKFVNK